LFTFRCYWLTDRPVNLIYQKWLKLPVCLLGIGEAEYKGEDSQIVSVGNFDVTGIAIGFDSLRVALGRISVDCRSDKVKMTITHDSWDFAKFEIETDDGALILHTMNEYMAVEKIGVRLATFPDLIAALSFANRVAN
jgi:hypothetical protein